MQRHRVFVDVRCSNHACQPAAEAHNEHGECNQRNDPAASRETVPSHCGSDEQYDDETENGRTTEHLLRRFARFARFA